MSNSSNTVNETSDVDTMAVWKDCCITLGHKFVKRGTWQYDQVKTLFKDKMDTINKSENPALQMWSDCCDELKIDRNMARTGTPEYNQVKALFASKRYKY